VWGVFSSHFSLIAKAVHPACFLHSAGRVIAIRFSDQCAPVLYWLYLCVLLMLLFIPLTWRLLLPGRSTAAVAHWTRPTTNRSNWWPRRLTNGNSPFFFFIYLAQLSKHWCTSLKSVFLRRQFGARTPPTEVWKLEHGIRARYRTNWRSGLQTVEPHASRRHSFTQLPSRHDVEGCLLPCSTHEGTTRRGGGWLAPIWGACFIFFSFRSFSLFFWAVSSCYFGSLNCLHSSY
jgi:hypothetical protein